MFNIRADKFIAELVEKELNNTNTKPTWKNDVFTCAALHMELKCEVTIKYKNSIFSETKKVHFIFGGDNMFWSSIADYTGYIQFNKLDISSFDNVYDNLDFCSLSEAIGYILINLQLDMEKKLYDSYIPVGNIPYFKKYLEIKEYYNKYIKLNCVQYDHNHELISLIEL